MDRDSGDLPVGDREALLAPDEAATTALATGAVNVKTFALLGAASTALAACSGGGGGSSGVAVAPVTPVAPVAPVAPVPTSTPQAQAARFLMQAQFSVPEADMSAVVAGGPKAWLDSQYAKPISTGGWDWMASRGYTTPDANRYYFSSNPMNNMIWSQLITAPDQLRKRLALALSEMLVVSIVGISTTWESPQVAGYWDVLNANVFGNFRTLLEAVTLNPAMGAYLNTLGNLKEDTRTGRQPDENYAREVMQLFTIGLFQLNADGTVKLDASGNRIPTYTQDDISNLARVFTGYNYDFTADTTVTVRYNATNTDNVRTANYTKRPMTNLASNHSNLAATFLGATVPANTPAAAALTIAHDTLFNHPNVGPFFASQMIQRLITSNPSPAYVGRVAAVFNDNGSRVRGDLKAVWTAILTDVEATTLPTANTAGKLREPIVRFVQYCRTIGVTTATGNFGLGDLSDPSNELSQSPFQSPTVFNFFRPGYVPGNTALAAANLVAPEFQIVSETSVAGVLNFMLSFMTNGLSDVKPDFSVVLSLASDTQALLDWLNLRFSANQVSATTIATIKTVLDALNVTAASTDAQKITLIRNAIYLLMASSEYLVQK